MVFPLPLDVPAIIEAHTDMKGRVGAVVPGPHARLDLVAVAVLVGDDLADDFHDVLVGVTITALGGDLAGLGPGFRQVRRLGAKRRSYDPALLVIELLVRGFVLFGQLGFPVRGGLRNAGGIRRRIRARDR